MKGRGERTRKAVGREGEGGRGWEGEGERTETVGEGVGGVRAYLEWRAAGQGNVGPDPVVALAAAPGEHERLAAAVAGARVDVEGADVVAQHVVVQPQPAARVAVCQPVQEAAHDTSLVALFPGPRGLGVQVGAWREGRRCVNIGQRLLWSVIL